MSNGKIKNRALVFSGIVFGLIVLYFALVYPFILNKSITETLEIEDEMLENDIRLIRQRPKKEAIWAKNIDKLNKYKGLLLEGDKPPVVAAMLQNTIKQMAEEEGINIERERPLNVEEKGLFIEIPVEISLRCSITKLTNLIYALEDYEKFLDISKINISVINIRNPIDIKATITVSGYILAREISKES